MDVLSQGVIKTVVSGNYVGLPITLQIIDIRREVIRSEDRTLLTLSDGENSFNYFMLPKYLEKSIPNDFKVYSLIHVSNGAVVVMDETKYFLIKALKPVSNNATSVLGAPTHLGFPVCGDAAYTAYESSNKSPGFHFIKDITMFDRNFGVIARVTVKGPLKLWNNNKGSGQYINLNLCDQTGEIMLTAFDTVAENLSNSIVEGKVYAFEKLLAKYDSMKLFGSQCKVSFGNSSTFAIVDEEKHMLPTSMISFTPIASLLAFSADTIVDVIGLCIGFSQATKIHIAKDGQEVLKKEITIADSTLKSVTVTLWGNDAKNTNVQQNDIVMFRRCKVTNFRSKSLTCMSSTTIQLNPNISEAQAIKTWSQNNDALDFDSITQCVNPKIATIHLLCDINDDVSEKPPNSFENYRCIAKIMSLNKEAVLYFSCSNQNCTKKLVKSETKFFCTSCTTEILSPIPNLFLQMAIRDDSETRTAVAFTKTAEELLGYSSAHIYTMLDEDKQAFDKLLDNLIEKSFDMQIKSRVRLFNNKQYLQLEIVQATILPGMDPEEPVKKKSKLAGE